MYLVAQISPFEWKKASVCNHYDDDDDDDDKTNGIGNEFHHHSSNSLNYGKDDDDDFMTNRETSIITMRTEGENTSTMELLEGENKNEEEEGEDGSDGGGVVEDKEVEEVVEKVEVKDGNCCEENYNTSTLQLHHQQYFKNMCLMNEENDLESIWINMESHRNFLIEKQRRQQQQQQHHCQIGSSKHHHSHENLDIDDDGLIGYGDVALKQVCDVDYEYDNKNIHDDDGGDDDESQNIELISYKNNFSLKNSFSWTLGTLLQSTSDLYPKV